MNCCRYKFVKQNGKLDDKGTDCKSAPAGAAVGASSGFTSGFITGMGNSLVEGEKLKQSLGKGLVSGAWGFGMGGITGGIQGGIRAARMGNDFWSGNTTSRQPVGYEQSVLDNADNFDLTHKNSSGLSELTDQDRYYLHVERFVETDQSTISRFNFPDGGDGYFLEPPGPSSVVDGSGLRIQAGIYEVVPHNGTDFQGVLRLNNVPGRTNILIHSGNHPGNTLGCLLPGLSYRTNWVGDSGNALQRLINLHRSYNRLIMVLY